MKTSNNKNPKGKLYAKYYNSLRNFKRSKLVASAMMKNIIDNDKQQKSNWIEREFGKCFYELIYLYILMHYYYLYLLYMFKYL
jgi:hypothetical protein